MLEQVNRKILEDTSQQAIIVILPSVWELSLIKVRLLLPSRDWEIGALSFLIVFQKSGSQVSKKDIPGL